MQKEKIARISTGAFAKLCNTSKRTLFHYDEIGLFSPGHTDDKGYRYYSETQCDEFFTITCLKELGMSLQEIKSFLHHRTPEELKTLLRAQQVKITQEMHHLRQIEQVIQTKIDLIAQSECLHFEGRRSPPRLEETPEETFLLSPKLDTDQHDTVIAALYEHIATCAPYNIGHPYGAMLRTTDLQNGHWERYAYLCTKVSSDTPVPTLHRKPAGTYAVLYLRGNYYDASDALGALLAFIAAQGLVPGPFCYKEAVLDETTVMQSTGYLTKISIFCNLENACSDKPSQTD